MITITKATIDQIAEIKALIDSAAELDTIKETFSLSYFTRLMEKGIVLIAISKKKVVGVCFGTYSAKEQWADLLGLVVLAKYRNNEIGTQLIHRFEGQVKNLGINTIDLYSDISQKDFYEHMGFKKGRQYISFRKII